MHLFFIHLHVYNSNIIFRKNKSLQIGNLKSTTKLGAVLFLQNSECSFTQKSALIFSHNIATLSGGITLISSVIEFALSDTKILFEFNEGGDGGAIAFYDKSYIKLFPMEHNWQKSNH